MNESTTKLFVEQPLALPGSAIEWGEGVKSTSGHVQMKGYFFQKGFPNPGTPGQVSPPPSSAAHY